MCAMIGYIILTYVSNAIVKPDTQYDDNYIEIVIVGVILSIITINVIND